jgi:8-oxo-dGTP diphosphatase
VHRPRYDDWSLPKGKADAGESDEDAAVREVEEETGVRCRRGPELSSTRYVDRRGRPKVVRYWLMEPEAGADGPGTFRPNDEVDEVRWCSAADAGKILTHAHDRLLIREAEDLR